MNTKKKVVLLVIFMLIFQANGEICNVCGKLIHPDKEGLPYYEYAKSAVKPAVICGTVIGGITYGVAALGFGPAGVIAGSLAAGYQATMGGVIGAGTVFASLQSLGAAGLSISSKLGITAGCTALVKTYDSVVGNDEETFCECNV